MDMGETLTIAMKWIPDEAIEEVMQRALGEAMAGQDGCGPRPGPGTRSGERQCWGKGVMEEKKRMIME